MLPHGYFYLQEGCILINYAPPPPAERYFGEKEEIGLGKMPSLSAFGLKILSKLFECGAKLREIIDIYKIVQ